MSRGAPPGARDNGLPATSWWAPLGECDPRVTGHLLEQLAAASIPAYAQPSTGSRGSYLELRPPRRPMDSLYVDNGAQGAARELLAGQLGDGEPAADAPREGDVAPAAPDAAPGSDVLAEDDTDALFAAIIAGFHGPDGGPNAGQSAGTLAPSPDAPQFPPRRRASDRPRGLLDPGGLLHDSSIGEGRPPRNADPFEDDDEHFERPPVDPAPPMHPVTKISVVAIIAGIALLLAPAVISLSNLGVSSTVGALLVAGGTAGLILRLRDDPPDGDGDGGAVV
jgi:hypothetical protein